MAYSQYFLILFLVFNSIDNLITQEYIQIPRREQPLNVALKRSFLLRCVYQGIGDGEFGDWFKQNATHDVSVNTDKPGHYVFKHSERESNLTIKIFVKSDANVNRWYVESKRSKAACEFGPISLTPSPQGLEDDKGEIFETPHESIRRTEEQALTLKCLIDPINENVNGRIVWEFSKNDQEYGELPYGISKDNAVIDFGKVKKAHRGYYRCKLDGVTFSILLRVKDQLAALWPFIGIVSVVLVLVIIILIFEKRQKSNKKNVSTDDDEQDRASDPLVRTTTKASDNDNKKRAVKA